MLERLDLTIAKAKIPDGFVCREVVLADGFKRILSKRESDEVGELSHV